MPVELLAAGTAWVCPSGVTGGVVDAEVMGAGAGGISGAKGGGGGGGAQARISSHAVTQDSSYAYSIGAGGVAGAAGGDTYWIDAGTLMAKGGSPGSGSTGGVGGAAGSSVGTTKYSGGTGGDGDASMGGGAGSCAGYNANGNNGANGVAGGLGGATILFSAANFFRGAGGNGSATVGALGDFWGSGGGGGTTGAAGRGGYLRLSYTRVGALTLYAQATGRLWEIPWNTQADGSGQNSVPQSGDTADSNGNTVSLHNAGGNDLNGTIAGITFSTGSWIVADNDYAYVTGCTFQYPFSMSGANSIFQALGAQSVFSYGFAMSNGLLIIQGSGIKFTGGIGPYEITGGTIRPYSASPIVVDGNGTTLTINSAVTLDLAFNDGGYIQRTSEGVIAGSKSMTHYHAVGAVGVPGKSSGV